jgi:hypothetical protein
MSVVNKLLDNSLRDRELLRKNLQLGDDLQVPRLVDFVFVTPAKEIAEELVAYVGEGHFGEPQTAALEDGFRVVVTCKMPVSESVLCCVSGLMACVATLFKVHYDGWGCVVQKQP